jgi:hypothetical protein
MFLGEFLQAPIVLEIVIKTRVISSKLSWTDYLNIPWRNLYTGFSWHFVGYIYVQKLHRHQPEYQKFVDVLHWGESGRNWLKTECMHPEMLW